MSDGVMAGSVNPWIHRWVDDERRRAHDETAAAREAELGRATESLLDALDGLTSARTIELEHNATRSIAAIEGAAAAGVAEIHWVADEHRRGLDDTAAARAADLEQTVAAHIERLDHDATRAHASFDQLASDALDALETAARDLHRELANELGTSADGQRATLERRADLLDAGLVAAASERVGELEHIVTERTAALEAALDRHATASELAAIEHAERLADQAALQATTLARLGEEHITELQAAVSDAEAQVRGVESASADHVRRLDEMVTAAHADFAAAAETRLAEGTSTHLAEVAAASAAGAARLNEAAAAQARALRASQATAQAAVERTVAEADGSLQATSEDLRAHLGDLRAELGSALENDAKRRERVLESAGSNWLARVNQAGRRRRSAVLRRRAAPPTAAMLLATGGAILGAGGGPARPDPAVAVGLATTQVQQASRAEPHATPSPTQVSAPTVTTPNRPPVGSSTRVAVSLTQPSPVATEPVAATAPPASTGLGAVLPSLCQLEALKIVC